MACTPWDPTSCSDEIGRAVAEASLGLVADAVTEATIWVITTSVSWWVTVPSIDVEDSPAESIRQWMVPIVVLIAVGGVLWNGLLLILTRKPQPLVNVARGLWNTALWGAVGIAGTHLVVKASDGYSTWVLEQSVGDVTENALSDRMQLLLVPTAAAIPKGIVLFIGVAVLIASFVQALLMLFRDGAVVLLAGMLQLAAAGSFTQATSGWQRKVLSWLLALATYKPAAATVYAAAFKMTGDPESQDPRVWFFGVAMLVISLIALPVLVRFFSWTTGSLASGGGGLGMLATAGAAGLHAGASLRGAPVVGGRGVNDYARYLDGMWAPSGSAPPTPPRPDSPTGGGPPSFRGPAAGAPAARPAGHGGSAIPMPAGAAGAPTPSTAGATSGGAAAAGAAGPAGAVVTGVATGVQTTVAAARTAADRAANAVSDVSRGSEQSS
jgi:hypothetical protein